MESDSRTSRFYFKVHASSFSYVVEDLWYRSCVPFNAFEPTDGLA